VDVDPPAPPGPKPKSPNRNAPILDDGQLGRLRGTRFGEVVQLAETTSTNSVLLEKANTGAPEGLVVVADYQSAGRGRFDRRWESPAGTSLLFSVLLRPSQQDLPLSRRHLAVAAVSLALVDGARAVAGVGVQLKWPNDLVVGDRKLAGVLTESPDGGLGGALVIGAGVNVDWAPEGAAQAATHLSAVAGRRIDRGELLVASLAALDRLYGHWDLVSQRYQAASATVGRAVTVQLTANAPPLSGTAVAVDEHGRLVVRDGAGDLVTVAAGDVTHLTAAGTPNLFPQ
jgi:BirA family biotin operon repressor/biotin-[acetyl-CoA-carboxylase] ligase